MFDEVICVGTSCEASIFISTLLSLCVVGETMKNPHKNHNILHLTNWRQTTTHKQIHLHIHTANGLTHKLIYLIYLVDILLIWLNIEIAELKSMWNSWRHLLFAWIQKLTQNVRNLKQSFYVCVSVLMLIRATLHRTYKIFTEIIKCANLFRVFVRWLTISDCMIYTERSEFVANMSIKMILRI